MMFISPINGSIKKKILNIILVGQPISLEDVHIPDQPQLICHHCQFIFYLDPKLAVVAFLLNKEKNKVKVLLLQQNEDSGKGLWAFQGGHVEPGHVKP
ncbi:NUDIX hydrolase [Shimazuella alba]|uniref:NUDIX domain-containing protein n=1 Tax=Shimazuella alba TaxID=2690964 RepID=A0A6I4VRW1_9BACL|nr:NUDIX hydrolase [Shimazuella alba]MXQ53171.1 NUDIX domain-containing protein [Shimazuella alba]